jgi:ABC-type lipoprotein export system ATPase subunit
MGAPILQAHAVRKSFGEVEVLHGVDLSVPTGELTLITGPSGSGKTTLLNILGGLEHPTSGEVMHNGQNIHALGAKELTAWRARYTGFAFQRSGLQGGLTAAENIRVPHASARTGIAIDKAWAGEVCARLGIVDILGKQASQLSGGQKQRVALARALIRQPEIVLADEPSAPLDTHSKVEIHDLMRGLVEDMGVTIALVSHDEISAGYAHSVVHMQDGVIIDLASGVAAQ